MKEETPMEFFKMLDQLSYKKTLSIAIFAAIIVAILVGVVLVQQQTRIASRAAFETPKPVNRPKASPGPVPDYPPQLGRVFPWIGKHGDVIWIQGKNFGTNPEQKKLTIGGVEVPEGLIDAWEDNLIQVVIPEGAKQGGSIEVKVGTYPPVNSLPIVLYDTKTATKIRKIGNSISGENMQQVAKAIIWTGDDVIPTERHEVEVASQEGKAMFFDTKGLPILSLVLLDSKERVVPYYVNPTEFGF